MFRDELQKFTSNVYRFIVGNEGPTNSGLVVKHTGTQEKDGDYSFPNTVRPWRELLSCDGKTNTDCTLLEYINKDIPCLMEHSKHWDISLSNAEVRGDRVHLFIDRGPAILVGLLNSIETHHIIAQCFTIKTSSVELDPLCDTTRDVTSLRVKRLVKVIENLYAINTKCRELAPQIFVTTKSNSKRPGSRIVHCGPVLNGKTGLKETTMNGEDVIRMRQSDLRLVFEHKLGGRIPPESPWSEYMHVVGESSLTYDLLRTKPNSPVVLDFTPMQGSNKEATYILYNSARLQRLLSAQTFPPLPDFEDTDFGLLTHEDEWNLIFNFILGLPHVLNNAVYIDEKTCVFRPHSICLFVSALVGAFSKYYRNVKVITVTTSAYRPHMLPVLFARIYMLKILNDCLKFCLKILNIKTVREM